MIPRPEGQGTSPTPTDITVSAVRTSRVSNLETNSSNTPVVFCELDSHADTCVLSPETALIVQDFNRPVLVHSYDGKAKANHRKTVSGVVAYDHPATGEVFMFVIHQAISEPGLDHILLCPNQLRDFGATINDEPKHMVLNPTELHNAIVLPATEQRERLVIPLSMHQVFSRFPTRKPAKTVHESTPLSNCIDLTDQDNEWDPSTMTRFQEQEDQMVDSQGRLIVRAPRGDFDRIIASFQST